jgi:two-component system response regulator ChvI
MTSETWHSVETAVFPQMPVEGVVEGAADSPQAPTRIVLVGGDDSFRRALCRDLAEDETDVVHFATALSAFPYLVAGNNCDVLVADLKTYDRSGLELLLQLQRSINPLPVVILAENDAISRQASEASAYKRGTTDFVAKSRGLKIITKTIELAAARAKASSEPVLQTQDLAVGSLELRFDTHAAFWRGRLVPLTVTEFKTVWLLAKNFGDNVSYREIYDFFRGKNFAAGRGPEGYRTNVRSVIRHIRRKFRDLDAEFGEIENFSRYGYRWRAPMPMALSRQLPEGHAARELVA